MRWVGLSPCPSNSTSSREPGRRHGRSHATDVISSDTPKSVRRDLESRSVTPSNPWGDERRQLLHQVQMRYQTLGRRRARRLCHRFERVGVHTAPERLRAMLAGVPVADAEVTDVNFALIAMQLNREARCAKLKRLKRQGTRSLLFAGLVLVVLNFLFCVAYVLLNLTQQATPY